MIAATVIGVLAGAYQLISKAAVMEATVSFYDKTTTDMVDSVRKAGAAIADVEKTRKEVNKLEREVEKALDKIRPLVQDYDLIKPALENSAADIRKVLGPRIAGVKSTIYDNKEKIENLDKFIKNLSIEISGCQEKSEFLPKKHLGVEVVIPECPINMVAAKGFYINDDALFLTCCRLSIVSKLN